MAYLTVSNAGFGRMQSAWPDGKPGIDYPWWDRALSSKQFTRQSLPALREKRTVEVFGATQPRLHHVRHLA